MPFYESLGFIRVGAVARYDESTPGAEGLDPAELEVTGGG